MYRLTCPHGCKTLKTQQPRSFINEETYNKHMKEFHNFKEPIKEPIKDYQEELNNISDKLKALELDNEHLKQKNEHLIQNNELLKSQLNNTQSITSVDNLKKIKSFKKKRV